MTVGSLRKELRHHIRGDGIEIGALHNPFDLSGLPVTRIRYVDRMPSEQLRLQYPELNDVSFVNIDIIDDGQILSTIPNGSLDFIIANHMIEHCDNTLGALENWLVKLREQGVLFLALPDKRRGWDERRDITSLEHILEDYRSTTSERKARNYEHFKSWTELVGNIHDEAHVRWLIEIDYSIHFHVFTFDSFRSLLDYARRELDFPFRILDSIEPADCSWESVFVLAKQPASASAP
jgi:SAM-dependent methyltransferase